ISSKPRPKVSIVSPWHAILIPLMKLVFAEFLIERQQVKARRLPRSDGAVLKTDERERVKVVVADLRSEQAPILHPAHKLAEAFRGFSKLSRKRPILAGRDIDQGDGVVKQDKGGDQKLH